MLHLEKAVYFKSALLSWTVIWHRNVLRYGKKATLKYVWGAKFDLELFWQNVRTEIMHIQHIFTNFIAQNTVVDRKDCTLLRAIKVKLP